MDNLIPITELTTDFKRLYSNKNNNLCNNDLSQFNDLDCQESNYESDDSAFTNMKMYTKFCQQKGKLNQSSSSAIQDVTNLFDHNKSEKIKDSLSTPSSLQNLNNISSDMILNYTDNSFIMAEKLQNKQNKYIPNIPKNSFSTSSLNVNRKRNFQYHNSDEIFNNHTNISFDDNKENEILSKDLNNVNHKSDKFFLNMCPPTKKKLLDIRNDSFNDTTCGTIKDLYENKLNSGNNNNTAFNFVDSLYNVKQDIKHNCMYFADDLDIKENPKTFIFDNLNSNLSCFKCSTSINKDNKNVQEENDNFSLSYLCSKQINFLNNEQNLDAHVENKDLSNDSENIKKFSLDFKVSNILSSTCLSSSQSSSSSSNIIPVKSPKSSNSNTCNDNYEINDKDYKLSISLAIEKSEKLKNLIGDFSRPYLLPIIIEEHDELANISPFTLVQVINGELKNEIWDYIIVDCRFPYEFQAGHIKGSTNIYTPNDLLTKFLKTPPNSMIGHILIFYCEFSSERGPKLIKYLRNQDRNHHLDSYPTLSYPEVYLLSGGYKSFFYQFPEYCHPRGYKPMIHSDHLHELRHFKVKSKTWPKGSKLGINDTGPIVSNEIKKKIRASYMSSSVIRSPLNLFGP